MTLLFIVATLLQAALILLDEFYFHWKRNLPKWERIGHPVDTAALLAPLSIAAFAGFSETTMRIYILLAIVSCLCVTKDEWVHREVAPATEQWLHAVLFVLHPVVLISAYFTWQVSPFLIQLVIPPMALFLVYQLLFWNFYANRFFEKRQ
ncbi:MAG: hypothetical protein ACK5P7_02690 [Bdellovibrio sp.]|jgi:hypothetical protein